MQPILGNEVDGPAEQLLQVLSQRKARHAKVGRPFPGPLPRWDVDSDGDDLWATEDETRAGIVGQYRLAWAHSDTTIEALTIDAPGFVPWWPRPDVKLFNVMVHVLTETSRHAGHADILREQLDGTTGEAAGYSDQPGHDAAFWESRCRQIERAARAANPAQR